MVKHQKDKIYQSAREHRATSLQRTGRTAVGTTGTTRKLPFNCCALTLTPFEHPVCTPDGIIFDNSAILPYLLRHKTDPVTGRPMTSRDLITLNMDRDEETNKWQCPVLSKPFSDHTKIVAVRQNPPGNEANVYSYEAVNELNFKPRNYEDLTSGKKFHRQRDVIVLLDPADDELNRRRDIDNFRHVAQVRAAGGGGIDGGGGESSSSGNVRHSVTARRVMEKLESKKKEKQEEEAKKRKKKKVESADGDEERKKLKVFNTSDVSGVQMTSGKCSGSLTSTVLSTTSTNEIRDATADEVLDARWEAMRKLKKKGYAKVRTNFGDLNVELHCDVVPRTTANFMGLAEKKKYDGSVFHRSIRNFMIQGGKPASSSGKGSGSRGGEGDSLWGGPFPDEFDNRLGHDGRGILAMANSGPNSNLCQFYITYKSCSYLDRKHTVFGRVVGGFEVLKAMEDVPTDKHDRPKKEIKILSVDVVVNPVSEAEEKERTRLEERERDRVQAREARRAAALGLNVSKSPSTAKATAPSSSSGRSSEVTNASDGGTARSASGVGKYLPKAAIHSFDEPKGTEKEPETSTNVKQGKPSRLPAAPKKTVFGDFSGW